jgi:hypothetical protein
MSHTTELRQRLEAGIRELEGDIAHLREAISALDGADASAPASPPAPPARRPRRSAPAHAASYDVVPSGKLVSLLAASAGGLSTSELAQQTNGNPDQVLGLLKELEQAGRTHRTGNRRSTRWHVAPAPGDPPASGRANRNGTQEFVELAS